MINLKFVYSNKKFSKRAIFVKFVYEMNMNLAKFKVLC